MTLCAELSWCELSGRNIPRVLTKMPAFRAPQHGSKHELVQRLVETRRRTTVPRVQRSGPHPVVGTVNVLPSGPVHLPVPGVDVVWDRTSTISDHYGADVQAHVHYFVPAYCAK